MPFPIPRPVIDGLPSAAADGAGPSHQAGVPDRFNDGASRIDNGRHHAAAYLHPHHRLDTTARPTAYTPELADRILDGLADGRTLLDVCDDEGMPAARTVHRWAIDDVEGFAARIREAREIGCHHLADETIAIADNGRNDWMARRRANGTPQERAEFIVDRECVRRSALRIEARQWLVAKRMPQVYGARPEPEAQPAAGEDLKTAALAEVMRVIDRTQRGLPKDHVPVRIDDSGKWVFDGGEHDGEPV
jgi:hypothetical protein